MSDLVGNHIVGFPMRWLINCHIDQGFEAGEYMTEDLCHRDSLFRPTRTI